MTHIDVIFAFVVSPPAGATNDALKKHGTGELKKLADRGKIPKGYKLDVEDDTGGATPPKDRGFPGMLFSKHNRLLLAEEDRQGEVVGYWTRIPLIKRS